MASVELQPPALSVALLPGFINNESKTLELRCRDQMFEDAVITDGAGTEIFHVKSPSFGKSWSWRRCLHDASGQHLLDLRHYRFDPSMKNRWIVEDPSGKGLATIEHFKQITEHHANVDLTIPKGLNGTEDVVVQMRQKDSSGITTFVALGGATVSEINAVERNMAAFDQSKGRDRTVWKIHVAPMTDLSLIAVMALCRAEMSHVWDRS